MATPTDPDRLAHLASIFGAAPPTSGADIDSLLSALPTGFLPARDADILYRFLQHEKLSTIASAHGVSKQYVHKKLWGPTGIAAKLKDYFAMNDVEKLPQQASWQSVVLAVAKRSRHPREDLDLAILLWVYLVASASCDAKGQCHINDMMDALPRALVDRSLGPLRARGFITFDGAVIKCLVKMVDE